MKKLFSSSAILLAATFFIAHSVQAQSSPSTPSSRNSSVDLSSENTNTEEVNTINRKAIKSFSRNYRTATAVKWFDAGELIQAYFVENGKQNRVFYLPNGKWFRSIITYDERLLDRNVKSLVNTNFRKYDITCVIEVHEANMDCYFINIEKGKDFKQVIVYEGEVFIHQEYTKQ